MKLDLQGESNTNISTATTRGKKGFIQMGGFINLVVGLFVIGFIIAIAVIANSKFSATVSPISVHDNLTLAAISNSSDAMGFVATLFKVIAVVGVGAAIIAFMLGAFGGITGNR